MQNFHGLQYRTHIIPSALLQRRAKVTGYSHLILPTVNYSSYDYYSYECLDYYDTLIGPSPQYLTILAFYNSCFTQMRARFLESESDAEQVDFLSAYPRRAHANHYSLFGTCCVVAVRESATTSEQLYFIHTCIFLVDVSPRVRHEVP